MTSAKLHRFQADALELIRKVTGDCPVCRKGNDNHGYFDIASAELGSAADQELIQAINAKSWELASRFQAANQPQDIRVWRALLCGRRVSLLQVIMKYEVWENDVRVAADVMQGDAAATLLEFIGDRWIPLGGLAGK